MKKYDLKIFLTGKNQRVDRFQTEHKNITLDIEKNIPEIKSILFLAFEKELKKSKIFCSEIKNLFIYASTEHSLLYKLETLKEDLLFIINDYLEKEIKSPKILLNCEGSVISLGLEIDEKFFRHVKIKIISF